MSSEAAHGLRSCPWPLRLAVAHKVACPWAAKLRTACTAILAGTYSSREMSQPPQAVPLSQASQPSQPSVRFSQVFADIKRLTAGQRTALHKIADYNGVEPFLATLCVGLICCMRAFNDVSDKWDNYRRMITTYTRMLDAYDHTAINYSTRSCFACFRCHKLRLADMPRHMLHDRVPPFVDLLFEGERQDSEHNYYTIQVFSILKNYRPEAFPLRRPQTPSECIFRLP